MPNRSKEPMSAGVTESAQRQAYRGSPMYAAANLASELVQQYGWNNVSKDVGALAALSRRTMGSKEWQRAYNHVAGRDPGKLVKSVKGFADERRGQKTPMNVYLQADNARVRNNKALHQLQSDYAKDKKNLSVGGQRLPSYATRYLAARDKENLRGAPERYYQSQNQETDKGFWHDLKQFTSGEGDMDLGGLMGSALDSAVKRFT